jgi:hypothetical protein
MTVEQFTADAVTALKAELVDIIREQSIVRKLYPTDQAVSFADGMYKYYKIHEQDNTQYGYELQQAKYSKFATEATNVPIPIHQGDLHFTPTEIARANKDVLTVDERVRETINQIVENEEAKCIYGDANTGTILSDTTNVSTAISDEIDLGTFAEGMQHIHLAISQLKALLKNKFQGCQLKIIQTTDTDARMRSLVSANETMTLYDYIGAWLVQFNGGGSIEDHMFASNYLGSATNAGTTNWALIASDPRNMKLIHSELDVAQDLNDIDGLRVQIRLRSKPVFFRGNDAVIYSGTTVLTA